jgi:dipeptidyl aminopeptidase/acylaminoacyl peptidase
MRLRLVDPATGATRTLQPEFDRSVGEFLCDGSSILLGVEEEGSHAIYLTDLDGAGPKRQLRGVNVSSLSASADRSVLVGSRSSLLAPAEVVRIRGDRVEPITRLNEELLAGVAMPACESVRWKGALDAMVQGWLLKPPGFDPARKHPFLLWIHGGPQGAWLDAWSHRWNPAVYAAQGYVVLLPNPHGSTGFGQQFTEQISGDWGGACFSDLMKGVDWAIAQGFVDADRMAAAGGSFGGYMVNWILGHSTRFKALVSHAGVYNLDSMYGVTEELWFPEWDLRGTPWKNGGNYEEFSPHRFAANFRTPTLVIHGELDYRVPVGEGFQLFTALRRQGVEAKLLYFPDEGHWVNKPKNSRLWNETVSAWFERHLKKTEGER